MMRSFLFFVAVIALIGVGIYLVRGKLGIERGGFSSGEISHSREWTKILPGRWSFKTEFISLKEAEVWEGEVEYFADGKMERFVSYKYYGTDYYSGKTEIEDRYIDIIAGGSVSGNWSVDTSAGVWKETVSKCQIVNSFVGQDGNEKFSVCDNYFTEGSTASYGNVKGATTKYEFSEFSQNKISIKGKSYSNDGDMRYIFSRIK